MSIKTADVCDDFANELQVCSTKFKSYGKKEDSRVRLLL